MNNGFLDILNTIDFESNSKLNYNVANLIVDNWDRKHQFIQANSDYFEISKLEAVNNQNRVNLVIPLLSTTTAWLPDFLNKVLLQIKNLEVDKIILHLVADTQVLQLWQSLVSQYSPTFEALNSKIVLGSISDYSYALNPDGDKIKLALVTRVITDPKVASLDNNAETIDGYFKLHYNSRYYENYDIYTENDLLEFESQNNISIQLQKILQKSYNQKVFPVDIRTNSLQKYDIIWYLDGPDANFQDLVKMQMELNLEYKLNQSILTNFTYDLASPQAIANFEIAKYYHPLLNVSC